MHPTTITLGAILLTGLGCLQMIGDLAGSVPLKALGAASHASPAPRVFTAHQGFETFSSRFFLEWTDEQGLPRQLELTPASYGRLDGPYNRRNAYGAALSYGPVLASNPATRPMFEAVSRHALCGKAPVLRELGINSDDIQSAVTVRLKPRTAGNAGAAWPLAFTPDCTSENDR
ncbi:MAG: hypothetical protein Q8J78_13230 [Moraxellaceae bacterium]|nr:hypothetical protein [Moraxellaceae bacterium]